MNYDFFLFVWYFAHLIVPLTLSKVLSFENTSKNKILFFLFGILLT